MLQKLWKSEKGFTLMELIIVIVILGILALIAVPRLLGFANQAGKATDEEFAAVVGRSAEMYYAANKRKPGILNDWLSDGTIATRIEILSDESMLKNKTDSEFEYYKDGITAFEVDQATGVVKISLGIVDGDGDEDFIWSSDQ